MAIEHTNGKDITNLYKYNKTNLSSTIKSRNNNKLAWRKKAGHRVNPEKNNQIIKMDKQSEKTSNIPAYTNKKTKEN